MLHEQFLSFVVVGCATVLCVSVAEHVTELTNAAD